MTKDELLRFESPAAKMLGRDIVTIDELNGGAVARYTAQPEFLNRHGTVQGGMVAAMLDSATALALYAALPPTHTAVTTSLNVSYLKPAKLGAFTAVCKLLRRDDRTADTSAELHDEEGVLVARAESTLRIVKRAVLDKSLE